MTAENPKKIIATDVFLTRGDEVLMGMKTRGLGAGCWNGYGGKLIEDDADNVEAAARR